MRSLRRLSPTTESKPRELGTDHLIVEAFIPPPTPASRTSSDSSLRRCENDHGHHHGAAEVSGIAAVAAVAGFGAAAYAFDDGAGMSGTGSGGGDAGAGGGDAGGDGGGGGE
ncbi:hypothetical protein FRC12_003348 [Ceratobasidium sp. 428]|nr:hypothetical protein FRC12_003348 [Ceratobasidium sp. 428]